MPVLDKLPTLEIIHGLKGTLDFYIWRGLAICRKWPVTPPGHMSPRTKTAGKIFGAISHAYSSVGSAPMEAYKDDAEGQPRTSRDVYMTAKTGTLHKLAPVPPPPHQELFRDWGNAAAISLERPGSAWTYGARRFEPTASGNVRTVTVRMKSNTTSNALQVHMQLRQDDAGEPANDIEETSSTVFNSVPAAYAEYVFEFDSITPIVPGVNYWVIMYRTDTLYATVNVIAASTADTPGRFDQTGQQPWNQNNRTIDLIISS